MFGIFLFFFRVNPQKQIRETKIFHYYFINMFVLKKKKWNDYLVLKWLKALLFATRPLWAGLKRVKWEEEADRPAGAEMPII